MPLNGYTVGRDVTVTVITPTGPLDLTGITSFASKANTGKSNVNRMDGINDYLRYPNGWSGTFDIDRTSSEVDDYFAELEAAYYAGNNELPATITETTTEVDGSISQYRYVGAMLTYDDAGTKAGNSTVKLKIGFDASRRLKVA